jgi:predicted nucleic acid-binding protein
MSQMNDKCFIDTNIFLYAFSTKDLHKQTVAKEIVLQPYYISTQVINESCSNFIKKLTFDEKMIASFIASAYSRYHIVNFSESLFLIGSNIRLKYKYSYYDSLIIAAALESKCTILYSEDMQHKQIIENNLQIINPFKGK